MKAPQISNRTEWEIIAAILGGKILLYQPSHHLVNQASKSYMEKHLRREDILGTLRFESLDEPAEDCVRVFADAFDRLDEIPSETLERREVREATTGRD